MFRFIRRLNLCFIMSEISRDFRRSFELEGARATSDCLLLIMRCASDPSNTSCRVCDMSVAGVTDPTCLNTLLVVSSRCLANLPRERKHRFAESFCAV